MKETRKKASAASRHEVSRYASANFARGRQKHAVEEWPSSTRYSLKCAVDVAREILVFRGETCCVGHAGHCVSVRHVSERRGRRAFICALQHADASGKLCEIRFLGETKNIVLFKRSMTPPKKNATAILLHIVLYAFFLTLCYELLLYCAFHSCVLFMLLAGATNGRAV